MAQAEGQPLTEYTKILLPISTFVILVFSLVSIIIFLVNWKADVEYRLTAVESSIVTNETEIKVIKDMQDSTSLQLVGIQTDLKWIIADMKKTNSDK